MTELPSNIGRLLSLKHLNVDSNRLESLPHELADLAQLEALSARSNRLRLVPPRMGALKNLRELDLAQNQLGDIPHLGPLFGLLGRLDLSHNQLQQLPSTCEIPVRKLNLNVSENASMASLPTVFGGFGYAAKLRLTAADDHQLKNAGGRVKVNTRGTNIRQGLVNEARLAAGRGIEKGRAVPGRHRPRLVPLEGSDWNSTSSELSFMRDHEESGEIEGLQHVGQGAEADETRASAAFRRGRRGWPSSMPPVISRRRRAPRRLRHSRNRNRTCGQRHALICLISRGPAAVHPYCLRRRPRRNGGPTSSRHSMPNWSDCRSPRRVPSPPTSAVSRNTGWPSRLRNCATVRGAHAG